MVDFSKSFQFFVLRISQSYNPGIAVTIPVWAPSISLAATLEIDVSFFSSSYLDVSVQRVSPHCWVTGLLPAGLSHSDIRGSILVCKSPRLFAAYHVLLRLQEPRHPPYALYYFLLSYRLPIVSRYAYLISLNYVNERRKSFDLPKNSTRFEPTPERKRVKVCLTPSLTSPKQFYLRYQDEEKDEAEPPRFPAKFSASPIAQLVRAPH